MQAFSCELSGLESCPATRVKLEGGNQSIARGLVDWSIDLRGLWLSVGLACATSHFFAPSPKTSPNGLFRVGVGLYSGGGTPKLFFAAPAVSRGCAEYSPSRPGYADLFVGTGVQSQISAPQESRPARRPSFPAGQIFA